MKLLAYDLETTIGNTPHGPDSRDVGNDFYTIIYGDNPNNIRVKHAENGFKRNPPDEFKAMLSECDILVGQNLPFDLGYISRHGFLWDWVSKGGFTWDCQIAHYLLSGQRHPFASLKELQDIYLDNVTKSDKISWLYKMGIGADKIIKGRHSHKRIWKTYCEYATQDGSTPLNIFAKQYTEAKTKGMLKIIKLYNLYMLGLVYTMHTGIHVDSNATEMTIRDLRLDSLKILQQAEDIVKPLWTDERLPPFNINSTLHKSAIFFGGDIKCVVRRKIGEYKNGKDKYKNVEEIVHVKGFSLPQNLSKKAKKEGQYSTDKEVMYNIKHYKEANEEVAEYVNLQIKAAQLDKVVNTYLKSFLDYSVNGKLYPYFNNTQTATGRLSSKNPNFQNLISKGEMAPHIKSKLVAPEGWICCSIDYSQLEIYISGLVSGDRALVNDLLAGIDFHIKRLSYAENLSYDEVFKLCKIDNLPEWDSKRTKTKTVSYQKAYGASVKSLSRTTGLAEDTIKTIFEKEDLEYCDVKRFNDHVLESVSKNARHATKKHCPYKQHKISKNGRRFRGGMELLPVYTQGMDIPQYDNELIRQIGYYQSLTGKVYAFDEVGQINSYGKFRRSFPYTQTMNYPVQGTAADVVAMATVELMHYILKNKDKVQIVNQVHDSIEFYVKEDDKNLIIPELCSIMENVPELAQKYLGIKVPFMFKVEAEIGKDFYNMVPYEKS